MKILVAGDFCLNNRSFVDTILNTSIIDSDILTNEIQSSDYSIVNLECPILNRKGNRINKVGPAIYNTPKAIDKITELGFKCLTLANNHINDYGEEGIISTRNICSSYHLDYVGIGMNKSDSMKILYKTYNDETVAIINCCEHEFSIASNTTPGACALNIYSQYYSIKEAKRHANYVIVIVHGGHEGWQYPTERMQETYRLFVDFGANAVINHHQHCWSGYEIYNNAPIFYGLGNFFFDWKNKQNCLWNEGYIVTLNLTKNNTEFSIIPYNQCDVMPIIRDLSDNEKFVFEDRMKRINEIISNSTLLNKVNEEHCKELSGFYCDFARPISNRIILALKNKGLLPRLYSKDWKTRLLSIIQCESHWEYFIYSLKH